MFKGTVADAEDSRMAMSDKDDCVKVVKIGAPVRDFTLINAEAFVEARRATDIAISRGETISWKDLRAEIDDA